MKSLMSGGALLVLVLSSFAQNPKEREDQPISLINSLKGADLYKAYCAVCHGADARGNGPMAQSLKNAPPDLTRIAARNGGSFPLARMRRVISGAEARGTEHGTREMPVWGPIFSQVDRDQDLGGLRIDNLARYLQNLQVK